MIAFAHQYQRQVKTAKLQHKNLEYIEVGLQDIELANKLAVKMLGVSLDDLPCQTRNFLEKVYDYVKEQCRTKVVDQTAYRFTRRELCEHMQTGMTQIGVHLIRLEKDEYVVKHRGSKGKRNVYELIYRGEGLKNSLIALGLADVGELSKRLSKSNGRISA